MRNQLLVCTLLAASLGLALGFPAWGDEAGELEEMLRAQGEMIEQLREEVGRLRTEQRRSEDKILALEDQLALPAVSSESAGDGEVTPAYVDRRIEDFETADESRLFLSGYGKVEFRHPMSGPQSSTFDVQFNPIFHFRLTDRLHFNAELEFELEDGETEVGLEFATIDYLATDWLTLSGGKFLVPFNVFGAKLHPPWINKMASRPVIYDKNGGLVPIISDVGAMASGGAALWDDDSKFNYAVYLGNGPKFDVGAGELEFENTPDENHNKTTGGRIGILPIPNLEVGGSWMTGKTSDRGRFELYGADFWYWIAGLELRGEYVRVDASPVSWGYYLQLASRLNQYFMDPTGWSGIVGRFEPVIRWGETKGKGPDNREQLGVGLNYWLFESLPLKFTYEFNEGGVDTDRLIVQIAYGF